jgi:hypothetical protein
MNPALFTFTQYFLALPMYLFFKAAAKIAAAEA